MISLYTGRPGCGKSLHACRDIRDALKYKKIPVIANFEVDLDAHEDWQRRFTYVPNSGITADYLVRFARNHWAGEKFREDGILLVLDECQLLYNSRNWQDEGRMKMLEFYSQHRKYGYKVILIAQSDIMIDKQFRTLIEYEVNHRKVSNYGVFGLVIRLLAFTEVFYACRYYYSSKVKLDGNFFRYRKSIARMYNSYSTFEMGGAGADATALPRSMIESESVNHAIMNGWGDYAAEAGEYEESTSKHRREGLPVFA